MNQWRRQGTGRLSPLPEGSEGGYDSLIKEPCMTNCVIFWLPSAYVCSKTKGYVHELNAFFVGPCNAQNAFAAVASSIRGPNP